MAKKSKKKARKVSTLGIVASIIILLMSVATFGVLEAPLYERTLETSIGSTTSTTTAYEFLENKSKKVTVYDENNNQVEKMQIELDKKAAQNYKDTILKNASTEATEKVYETMMNPIKVYDTLIISMALAAVGCLCSLISLILGLLKKNKAAKIFNILGVVTLVGILVAGAIAFSSANAIAVSFTGSVLGQKSIVKTIAPILVMLIGAVGTLAGGLTTMLAKK